LALAWALLGAGAAFFAFVDAVDDGEHGLRMLSNAGPLVVVLLLAIAASFGPLTVYYLRHRL
jgi:hypothetical protein